MSLDWGKSKGNGGGRNGSFSGGRDKFSCRENDSIAVTKQREESIARGSGLKHSEAINGRHWLSARKQGKSRCSFDIYRF